MLIISDNLKVKDLDFSKIQKRKKFCSLCKSDSGKLWKFKAHNGKRMSDSKWEKLGFSKQDIEILKLKHKQKGIEWNEKKFLEAIK